MDLIGVLRKEEKAVEKQVHQLSARLQAIRQSLVAFGESAKIKAKTENKARRKKPHWSQLPQNRKKLARVQAAALRARRAKVKARKAD